VLLLFIRGGERTGSNKSQGKQGRRKISPRKRNREKSSIRIEGNTGSGYTGIKCRTIYDTQSCF
ncbi:MAG: hypothetical protein K2N24_02390, partial [Lachnospiraceae bacterium]|nr:hypothetical protein [Lachnospiraceae bacterium]